MLILGIETSCDDTGIAIVEINEHKSTRGLTRIFNIKSNIVSSQIKVHQKYGGVVPNLAAREHLKNIAPCLKTAMNKAGIKPEQIDLIAVTVGPGLIPSLLIGVNFAKALAYAWNKPIVGVNHIEGHIVAALDSKNSKFKIRNSKQIQNFKFLISKSLFPAIALVVSGGHTQLILVKKIGQYKIIGETRDDAAGECFDKIAKLLKLGYPGGPAIAKMASDYKLRVTDYGLHLPRPMIKQKNYDFSFSGLKTAVLYLVKDMGRPQAINVGRRTSNICAEVQQAIIDVLIEKTIRAAKEYKTKTVILSGGVAANEELRKQLAKKLRITDCGLRVTNFLVPPKNLCTDNGAMIAMAGYFAAKRSPDFGRGNSWRKIKADANLRLF